MTGTFAGGGPGSSRGPSHLVYDLGKVISHLRISIFLYIKDADKDSPETQMGEPFVALKVNTALYGYHILTPIHVVCSFCFNSCHMAIERRAFRGAPWMDGNNTFVLFILNILRLPVPS